MGKTYDYERCVWYVEDILNMKLFPYQKLMLKAFCDGLNVRTARGLGRTTVASQLGSYAAFEFCKENPGLHDIGFRFGVDEAKRLEKNDFTVAPDVIFPYTCGVKYGLLNKGVIESLKSTMSERDFNRDFLCL